MVSTKYRLLSAKLRVQRGPGRPDLVVERPFTRDVNTDSKVFSDSAEEPTLVSFDQHCQVDIAMLLATGAIAEVADG